ncbi:hypothetical protein NL676_004374 [Syzygium grande]|nr:hypothetical protein NL676_004374 [Syzygium grande]
MTICTNSDLVLEPENAFLGPAIPAAILLLHLKALSNLPPEGFDDRGGVDPVVQAEDGLDGSSRLDRVIVRHGRAEVVDNVGVGDVVEDLVEDAVVAVHRGEQSPEPVPLRRVVAGDVGMEVVQIAD